MSHNCKCGRVWTVTIPKDEYKKLIEENADNRFTAAERSQRVYSLECDLKKLKEELEGVRKSLADMTWWKNHYADQVSVTRQKLAAYEKADAAKADAAKADAAPAQEPWAE